MEWILNSWWKKTIYVLGWASLIYNILWFLIGFMIGYLQAGGI